MNSNSIKIALLSYYHTSNIYNDIGNGYIRAFKNNGVEFLDYKKLYYSLGKTACEKFIFNFIAENKIDALICMFGSDDFYFDLDFFHNLRQKIFTAMMVGDAEQFFHIKDIYYAQCVDLMIDYSVYSQYRFKLYGIDAMCFLSSFDKGIYKKISGLKPAIDVSFIGDMSSPRFGREEKINFLKKNNIDIKIFGRGSAAGQIKIESMVEVFNSSKINLNFTGINKKNSFCRPKNIDYQMKQIKGRIAEIALCGGFVLTEYAPGIEKYFEPENEIEVFYTEDEMLEKIKYFLAHGAERQKIADRAYNRALRDYETGCAIPRLLTAIGDKYADNIKKKRDIFIDDIFIKFYTAYRIKIIIEFIFQRKFAFAIEEMKIIFKYRKINILRALKYIYRTFVNIFSSNLNNP